MRFNGMSTHLILPFLTKPATVTLLPPAENSDGV